MRRTWKSKIVIICCLNTSIGLFSYFCIAKNMQQVHNHYLTLLLDNKTAQVATYFDTLSKQINLTAKQLTTSIAMKKFIEAYNAYIFQARLNENKYNTQLIINYLANFKQRYQQVNNFEFNPRYFSSIDDAAAFDLQYNYIFTANLDDNQTMYDKLHQIFHPVFLNLQHQLMLEDVLFIDAESGRIVYSSAKNADFSNCLLRQPYQDTHLALAFSQANTAISHEAITWTKFAPYAPSYNESIAFIATPVFYKEQKLGILAFKVSIEQLNKIVADYFGDTGEVYLIDQDFTMQTRGRFSLPGTAIQTQFAKAVMQNESNSGIFKNYNHQYSLVAYRPLTLSQLRWGMIANIDVREINQAAQKLTWKIIGYCFAISMLWLFDAKKCKLPMSSARA
jgi:methyl-accepting chemotaxis protein